jgi:hypothetical protein
MGVLVRWSGLFGASLLTFAAFACSSRSGALLVGTTDGNDSGAGDATASSSGGGSSGAVGSSSSFGNGGTSSGTSLGTGVCETGFYSGTFSCFFFYGIDAGIGEAPDSGGIGPITGTMSFKLTQDVSSHGELETTDTASGTFDAATGLFIAADADLSGTLDCTQGKFTGQLVNGEYGFNIGGMPIPDPNNRFQGPLVADYNGSTSTFVNGQWSMMVAGEGPCIGSWTAAYAGPLDGGVDGAPPSPADASGD